MQRHHSFCMLGFHCHIRVFHATYSSLMHAHTHADGCVCMCANTHMHAQKKGGKERRALHLAQSLCWIDPLKFCDDPRALAVTRTSEALTSQHSKRGKIGRECYTMMVSSSMKAWSAPMDACTDQYVSLSRCFFLNQSSRSFQSELFFFYSFKTTLPALLVLLVINHVVTTEQTFLCSECAKWCVLHICIHQKTNHLDGYLSLSIYKMYLF